MCLAVPGRIEEIQDGDDPLGRRGRVRFGELVQDVNLSCVPDAGIGDFVVVHVGLAISKLDQEEAEQTLKYLDEAAKAEEDAS